MPKRRQSYLLTKTAARDFREARRWSKARWGDQTTKLYLQKLHDGAEYIAAHQDARTNRDELTGNTGLGVYPIGEHFLVYVPLDRTQVAIVALIRQVRDVPAILQASHFQIQRALNESLEEFSEAVERDRLKSQGSADFGQGGRIFKVLLTLAPSKTASS